MTWQSVGTHLFVPTDRAVQVGSFDLAAGQDTIWVRITQLNPVDDWPWSYGILSWRNANGTPLGSIKAYSNRLGEVFRLGNGLPPSDGTGSIWFEPRGFNLGWLKAGFPWQLQFEAQAGASDLTSGYWNRDPNNGLITPRTQGDNLDMGTGWIQASNLPPVENASGNQIEVAGFQSGTWTPVADFGYSAGTGFLFWRIGNAVTLQGQLGDFSNRTDTSTIKVAGLPYPPGATVVNTSVGSCMSKNTAISVTGVWLNAADATPGISFFENGTGTADGWNALKYNETTASTLISWSVSYLTDDNSWQPSVGSTVT